MTWQDYFNTEAQKPYFIRLRHKIETDYANKVIYPAYEDLGRCFELCSLENLKVVILGQDPYFQPGVADGLAFSSRVKSTPASLKNIFKELEIEYPEFKFKSNDLSYLASQGVLLLNTCLTVEDGVPNSHRYIGYDELIKNIVEFLEIQKEHLVYLLWGNSAKKYREYITNHDHLILENVHPSPLSASKGWFNSNCFIDANTYLADRKLALIKWIP
jgi:uracil-DNA glycosylase